MYHIVNHVNVSSYHQELGGNENSVKKKNILELTFLGKKLEIVLKVTF